MGAYLCRALAQLRNDIKFKRDRTSHGLIDASHTGGQAFMEKAGNQIALLGIKPGAREEIFLSARHNGSHHRGCSFLKSSQSCA